MSTKTAFTRGKNKKNYPLKNNWVKKETNLCK